MKVYKQKIVHTHNEMLFSLKRNKVIKRKKKRNEVLICATRSMNPEDIMLSEIRHAEDKYCIISLT